MARAKIRLAFLAAALTASTAALALAQSDPSNAAFPEPAPTPAQPAPPAQPSPAAPPTTPVAQPPSEPAPVTQPPAAAPPAEPPPPPPAQPTAPAEVAPYSYAAEPPPPPERPREEGFEMPPFSVRVDPFNWLLHGKLGFELEAAVLDFMTIELVPEFIVNEQPPTFNFFDGRKDPLFRESDGIGPLSGTSLGVGFWLEGKPLRGYVLRAILTNYGYHYRAVDEDGEFDNVSHVERHFYGFFGSHGRWGAFTLAGGIGLGVELNKETRCFRDDAAATPTRSGCPDNELLIKTDRNMQVTPVSLSGGLGGVQLLGRFSLGVAID